MNNSFGRSVFITVGVVVLVVGAIFAGQGAGFIPGSVMTGDPKWLIIGSIMAVIGIVLIVLGLRRRRSTRS